MRRVAIKILASAGLVFALAVCQAGIATSKPNLTATGPGTIRAATETQTCVFCHTPHNASAVAPLWNRNNPGGAYIPYTSSSAIAHPGQPTGSSLLCLSCHDGTIALGDVLSRGSPIAMAGGITTMPPGNANLGTNLSDDHPVSFVYDATLAAAHNGELADPAVLTGKVKLDPSGQLQCTSCHDPHDDSNGKFLVMPNFASALCKLPRQELMEQQRPRAVGQDVEWCRQQPLAAHHGDNRGREFLRELPSSAFGPRQPVAAQCGGRGVELLSVPQQQRRHGEHPVRIHGQTVDPSDRHDHRRA